MANASDREVRHSAIQQSAIQHWQPVQPRGSRAALLISALIALTACGGGVAGGGISGQLSGPTNANLNKTSVAAFVCNNACQAESDITNTIASQTVISSAGSNASYQLPNVPAGTYFVLAVQDTNGSGKLDAGDLVGAVSGVPSPAANVNIKLQAATVTAANALGRWARTARLEQEPRP
jgi:uncharacterized protein (DUF2141 family)